MSRLRSKRVAFTRDCVRCVVFFLLYANAKKILHTFVCGANIADTLFVFITTKRCVVSFVCVFLCVVNIHKQRLNFVM